MLQVWVVGELQDDGLLKWQADSDSQLTKVTSPPLPGAHARTHSSRTCLGICVCAPCPMHVLVR